MSTTEENKNLSESLQNSKSIVSAGNFFAEVLTDAILRPNEEINDSQGDFWSHFAYLSAMDARVIINEVSINKNEMNVNTAVMTETLMSKLDSNELSSVMGYPSQGNFVLGLPKKGIIEFSVAQADGTNIIRINKDANFVIDDKYKFILDADIIVSASSKNMADADNIRITANYDLSEMSLDQNNMSPILSTNTVIKTVSHIQRNEETGEDEEYIMLFVTARNMDRVEKEIATGTKTNSDFNIQYYNSLYAFEIWYKANETDPWTKLKGYPKGSMTITGYEYALDTKQSNKLIKIEFSKKKDGFVPAKGSYLKIISFSTIGEAGNITIGENTNSISEATFNATHDISVPEESAVSYLVTKSAVLGDMTINGANQKTHNQIREYIISRSNGTLIATNEDFNNICKQNKYDYTLVNFNLNQKYYRILAEFNSKYGIITTGTNKAVFNKKDIPFNSRMKAYIIRPDMYFKLSDDKLNYYYDKNDNTTFQDYIKKNILGITHISFPFFLYCEFTNRIKTAVFDMSVNTNSLLSTTYLNPNAYDSAYIQNVIVTRNPINYIDTTVDETDESRYFYKINFIMITSSDTAQLYVNTINDPLYNENNKFIKFKINFVDEIGREYVYNDLFNVNHTIEVNIDKGEIHCEFLVYTNNVIDNGLLNIVNNTLLQVPVTSEMETNKFINFRQQLGIKIYFRDPEQYDARNTHYDRYLKPTEKTDKYVLGVDYDLSDNVHFGINLTDIYEIPIHQTHEGTDYEVYPTDVLARYTENIPQLDENGDMVTTVKTIPDTSGGVIAVDVPVYEHTKGELILTPEGNTIIAHHKGDHVKDENNKPIVKEYNTFANLNYLPWVDRIFLSSSNYADIVKTIRTEIEGNYREFTSKLVDGHNTVFAHKNTDTASNSKYSIILEKTKDKILLESCSIILAFNLKLQKDVSKYTNDEIENIELNIKTIIDEYIYNFNSEYLSFTNMIDHVKQYEVNIYSMTCTGVNKYVNSETQTIYNDVLISGDKLVLKTIIDLSKTTYDEQGNPIYFYTKGVKFEYI